MSPKNEEVESGLTPVAEVSVGQCFFCGTVSSMQCEYCKEIFFCTKVIIWTWAINSVQQIRIQLQDHFLIHRPESYCYPFIVKTSSKVGRYVVASRDIAPCEVILRENPAVVGPYTPTTPLCLTCFRTVDMTYLCPDCNLPMCDSLCAQSQTHKQVIL